MTDRHDDAARDLVRRAHHSDPEPADLDIKAGLADVLARGGQQAPNRTQPAGEATQPSVQADLTQGDGPAQKVPYDKFFHYAEAVRAAGIPPGGIGPTRARALRQPRKRLAERGLTAATTARKTSENDSPSVPRGHREALLDGARRCLLERGYAGTTARDLVAASGTTLASIGYHFGSKEALLTEAMRQCFDEYIEQIAQIAQIAFADPSATPLQQVWASWETLVSTFDQYRPLMVVFFEALARAERVPELQAQLAECYERLRTTVADMVHASADGLSDTSARQVASFLIATYNGLHVQWLLDPERAHHNDPEPADLDIRAGLADVLARGGQQAPLAVDVAIEVILDGLDGDTRSSLSRAELVSSGRSAPATGTIIELKLTPQELQISLAIQRGLTNDNVAAELILSVKTIEYHLSNIYRKLGISSRTQLIRVLNEGRMT